MSPKVKRYEVKVWPNRWEMLSVDPDCMALLTYTCITRIPIRIKECLPWQTRSGVTPEVETEEVMYSGFNQLVRFFCGEGFNADGHLTSEQEADKIAFLSYLEQQLKPAITYALWADNQNYNEVTRPAYAKMCGFPRNFWVPGQMREKAEQFVMQGRSRNVQGKDHQTVMLDFKRPIYMKAKSCMNVVEQKLTKNDFFFGDKPSSLDALIYGYLTVLVNTPLKSFELKQHLNSCENLKKFCERMNKLTSESRNIINRNTSTSSTSVKKTEACMKKETIITLGIGVSAMVLYGILFGIFTSRRSLLAHKLGTVSKK